MIITIPKGSWRSFLKKAKSAYPKEYLEVVCGHRTPTGFEVTKFVTVPHTTTGNADLHYDERDLDSIRLQTISAGDGDDVIGTIHTHTISSGDTSLSECDLTDAWRLGEHISGVVNLTKKDGKFIWATSWWVPALKVKAIFS